MYLFFNPAILFLEVYVREMKVYVCTKIGTSMYLSLFKIANDFQ